jgi:ribosomal protein S12 methylthiotransferase
MTKKWKKTATVGFVSLGCPKNVVDSEKMLAEIGQGGFFITSQPDNAEIIVINTCGFIAPAVDESLEAIRWAVGRKTGGAVKKVIVAGCLSERLGRKLFDKVEGIDAIIGLGGRDKIAQVIKKTLSSGEPATYLDPAIGGPQTVGDDRGRLLITPRHWAYLRISDGCSHRCSFCTIPAIKGRFRSKPAELVLAEAAELVSAGVVELNVIAQDTTRYGYDLNIEDGLSWLVKELERIAGLVWIRLMYLYPAGINEKLIEVVAKSEKIVHYFDIPIQHVNDEVLRAMGRPDTKESLKKLIEKLRNSIAGCLLRTTIIVGFPGETDEQFAELLEFVRWAEFDALGCFKFYPESGTRAAEMPGQVSDEVKQQRLEELMLTQQEISFAKNKKKVGSELVCLVDSVESDRTGKGRFYGQAPDIDSICIIKNCSARAGDFINAKVTGTKDYDLVVEPR